VWQALREEVRPKGLEIVTVALDVDPEDARPWIDAAAPRHPSLVDRTHVTDELLGFVNVPNGVWIDETGMLVRPAEPAFPGRNPVLEPMVNIDPSTLPPELADVMVEVKKLKSDPEAYRAALVDWADNGAASDWAMTPDEVVARSQVRGTDTATAAAHFELAQHLQRAGDTDAAIAHFKEAHRLQPDNWTYKRQAWHLVAPGSQTKNDVYEGNWLDDIRAIGAENYYPEFTP
jgi:hypothetical protein